ncbi:MULTISPECIES: helix-turn-helix domain-containing protein, partial [unclassified Mesorhizobium]|uniref:helix-turn-helix domain-containing protein n=2 Tax=unclassified Mesorhizobium TaxID=325217 RepID=UPI00333907CD
PPKVGHNLRGFCMSKYSESFKRSVVDSYLGGDESCASAASMHGVDAATVRKWVALYQAHGDAGLSGKYGRYDAAFRLSVLERMWEEGLSYRQTAALFNIRNASCLTGWEKRYHAGGIEALGPRPRGRPMSKPPSPAVPVAASDEAKSREELLAELKHLRMENDYLKKLEALTQGHALKKRKPSRR